MREIIELIINFLIQTVETGGPVISIIVGMLIIIIESIIPVLPLAVFIAINMVVFGNVTGFIISWIATIIGCLLAFTIYRRFFKGYVDKKIENNPKLLQLSDSISNIKFSNLVLLMALPFTPAFAVNIAAGLSKISYRKFLFSVILSKLSIIYFWGFIGTTLIESITDINVLIELGIVLLLAYLLSKFVNKRFNIE